MLHDSSRNAGKLQSRREAREAKDANGVVIYRVTVPPRGITWRYRVEVPGQLPYISSLSAPVSITGT